MDSEFMYLIINIIVLLSASHKVQCKNYTNGSSLDGYLQESAFETLFQGRPRTGDLYQALLPANLSGIEVSIVRLRSKRLYDIGANFSHFQIPPRTKTVPHVKRLIIVYQDLGNWSSSFYNVPSGYSMATPVIGFLVFNASNERARNFTTISLEAKEKKIKVQFPGSRFLVSGAKCVRFRRNREVVEFSEVDELGTCLSTVSGEFCIAVPLQEASKQRRKSGFWIVWLVVTLLGLCGLVLMVYYGLVSVKVLKTKKIEIMERQADEDLVLETLWVGHSKMPSATTLRTQPSIESGGFSLTS